jgi:hypothetical protein
MRLMAKPKPFPEVICSKCKIEKPRKEFQRDSKEYKSCNECSYRVINTIDQTFKMAFELLNQSESIHDSF